MPHSTPRLLYIDDDEGLCRLARRRLERSGIAVTTSNSGDEGLALAQDGGFHVVALDHYMPGQDGLETLGRLMALPETPAVIYVTGSEETHVAVAALKAGAFDYVSKSASEDFFDLLSRTIEQALDARRARLEKELSEQRLRETNNQLEAMLGEMNHRVANSLQMVSAVVSLQSRMASGAEARAMLQDIRQRIHAVGRIHRQLYVGGGSTTIAMDSYIAGLAEDLADSFSTAAAPRTLRVEADAARLPASVAVTTGILINELVSNACKYAYAPDQPGEVRIHFRHHGSAGDGSGFTLAVEDDGQGYQEPVTPTGTGLGSQIIRIMTESLGAQMVLRQLPTGFRVEIATIA